LEVGRPLFIGDIVRIQVGPRAAWLIGDPHLGKKFEVGVPLNRRGEREAHQMALFKQELATPDVEHVVMVGDLFDHPYVGYAICLDAAEAVLEAARDRPDVQFYMMAGNHDVPKNVSTVGAFHTFASMVRGREPNLWVITAPGILDNMAFFPWEWGVNAEDQVHPASTWRDVYVAIGHWDLNDFGPSVDGKVHLVPVARLRSAFGDGIELYGGHYHTEGDYVVAGVTVHGTGSLEPYSHGEDPAGARYITLDREQAVTADADYLRDRCVRVRLRPGEDLPALDALAVTPLRVRDEEADQPVVDTRTAFDWGGILATKLAPLAPIVKTFITERLSTNDDSSEE
jgi:hypothetical protein